MKTADFTGEPRDFIGQSLVKMQSVKSTNYRKRGLTITERILAKSHYYEVAREFGRLCVARVGATGYIATCSTCWELDHDNLAVFGLAQTALTASL